MFWDNFEEILEKLCNTFFKFLKRLRKFDKYIKFDIFWKNISLNLDTQITTKKFTFSLHKNPFSAYFSKATWFKFLFDQFPQNQLVKLPRNLIRNKKSSPGCTTKKHQPILHPIMYLIQKKKVKNFYLSPEWRIKMKRGRATREMRRRRRNARLQNWTNIWKPIGLVRFPRVSYHLVPDHSLRA